MHIDLQSPRRLESSRTFLSLGVLSKLTPAPPGPPAPTAHICSYQLTPACICSHQLTPAHTSSHQLTSAHTSSHKLTLAHTSSHQLTPAHISSYQLTSAPPAHTSCTSSHQLAPARQSQSNPFPPMLCSVTSCWKLKTGHDKKLHHGHWKVLHIRRGFIGLLFVSWSAGG